MTHFQEYQMQISLRVCAAKELAIDQYRFIDMLELFIAELRSADIVTHGIDIDINPIIKG